MSNNNKFDRSDFVVSYELLKLLEWLTLYGRQELKELLNKAILNNVLNENISMDNDPEKAQENIAEFLLTLDNLLQESVKNKQDEELLQKALIPAINHVDVNNSDINLEKSIARATNKKSSNKKTKELFYQELLKGWRPNKSDQIN